MHGCSRETTLEEKKKNKNPSQAVSFTVGLNHFISTRTALNKYTQRKSNYIEAEWFPREGIIGKEIQLVDLTLSMAITKLSNLAPVTSFTILPCLRILKVGTTFMPSSFANGCQQLSNSEGGLPGGVSRVCMSLSFDQ
jgi:hypothetical protein